MDRIIHLLRFFLYLTAALAPIGQATAENQSGDWLAIGGDGHTVMVIDGVAAEPGTGFTLPSKAVTLPVFSAGGRYVFLLGRDGWVRKYDLQSPDEPNRAWIGPDSHDLALSDDGQWLAVARPDSLTILAAGNLSTATVHEINGKGEPTTRLAAIHVNPVRESFVLELAGAPRIWEVFYGANPPAMGFAHDWRHEGPVEQPTPFPVRKFTARGQMSGFAFDPTHEYILGGLPEGRGMVTDLVIALWETDLALPGQPLFASGTTLRLGDGMAMAFAYHDAPVVSLIELEDWQELARISVAGTGGFVAGHDASSYLWAGGFAVPSTDMLQLIDPHRLEVTKTLRPAPGSAVKQATFSADGSQVWVVLDRETDAVIVYDSRSLTPIGSLPVHGITSIHQIPRAIDPDQ